MIALLCLCMNMYAQGENVSSKTYETAYETVFVSVNQQRFTLNLYANETTKAFTKTLPLTVPMRELNGNEKYFHLPTALPIQTFYPKMIQKGDVMLWGNNSLVLFYKTFPSSHAYTKIGFIEDTTYLEEALGASNVVVRFEK